MSDYQLTSAGVTRRSDGARIPIAPGNRDWQEYQEWLALGNTPDPIPGPTQAELIDAAWTAADTHATQFDANSRVSLLWYMSDPACPTWRMQRIVAIQTWWAAVWAEYANVKAHILDGDPIIYNTSVTGDCPYNIWHLAQE